MNANEIRYYMHSYDNLGKEIGHLKTALEVYRGMNISGIKAQVITDEPLTHSNTSKTEQMALERLEYMQSLEEDIDSKIRLFNAINSIYFYLTEPDRSIIEMRYFIIPQGRPKYSWKEIAYEVNESEDNCKMKDSRIIRKIQNKLLDTSEERKAKTTA